MLRGDAVSLLWGMLRGGCCVPVVEDVARRCCVPVVGDVAGGCCVPVEGDAASGIMWGACGHLTSMDFEDGIFDSQCGV